MEARARDHSVVDELRLRFRGRVFAARDPLLLHDQIAAAHLASAALRRELMRPASVRELAERMHLEDEEVLEIFAANHDLRRRSVGRSSAATRK